MSTWSAETTFTDVRSQAGHRAASDDAACVGRDQAEGGRVHRLWPLLRVAEEAPGPASALDQLGGLLGELGGVELEPTRSSR